MNRPIVRVLAAGALTDLVGVIATAAYGAIHRDLAFTFTSMAMTFSFFMLLIAIVQVEKNDG